MKYFKRFFRWIKLSLRFRSQTVKIKWDKTNTIQNIELSPRKKQS